MPKGQHTLSETELVRRLREGDHISFKGLYDLYKNRIFSTALRILGNRQDTEDAVQEIFIRIYRCIHTFREDAAFRTCVYKIAVNTCINHLKKRKRIDTRESASYPDNAGVTDGSNPPSSVHMFIEREITRLPEKCRTVFILYEIEGFKHHEIAKIMKISEGTSKSQLFFAKSSLRKKLKPYVEELKNGL